VGSFPFVRSYPQFAAVRVIDGMCSVGIGVACETILLSRADKRHKAFVVSLYAIAMGIGYVVGPIMAHVIAHFAPMEYAFVAAGAIALSSAALVLAKLDEDVADSHRAHVVEAGGEQPKDGAAYRASHYVPVPAKSAGELLAKIRTSCFATFAYGYFQASVVLFLPLFLIEAKHIPAERTMLIPAFFAAGMLALSNFTARFGDRDPRDADEAALEALRAAVHTKGSDGLDRERVDVQARELPRAMRVHQERVVRQFAASG
jgi:MFS family permease